MKLSTQSLFAVLGFSLVSAGASGAEPPQPKPGLWEIRMQQAVDGQAAGKPAIMQRCFIASEYAQSKAKADDFAKKNCSKNETRQEGGKWVNDMVCKVGTGTMTTHSTTAYNGENAYHSEMTSTFDPPTPNHSRSITTSDGKWMGACKAG